MTEELTTDMLKKEIIFTIEKANDEEASFWAIGSTKSEDRDGDIISPDAWDFKNFKKNPVIPLFHDYHSFPVAKADKIKIENGQLMFKPIFAVKENPQAQIAYSLYKGGYMNAWSVGFLPQEWKDVTRKNGRMGRDYTKVELLEISAVVVPSNPNALALARSKGINVDLLNDKESDNVKKEIEEGTETIKTEEITNEKFLIDITTAIENLKKEIAVEIADIKLSLKAITKASEPVIEKSEPETVITNDEKANDEVLKAVNDLLTKLK